MVFAVPALAVASVVATVAGGIVGAVGALTAAQANATASAYASAEAQYQSQVAKNNQAIANANATYATEAGETKAEQQELTVRAVIGNQKAAQGSSGLDVNTGSAVDVRSSTAALGELSVMNIRNNAARENYGFRVQAANYGAQSELDTTQSELDNKQTGSAITAGYFGAAGSILGSAGTATGQYANFSRNGAFQSTAAPNLVR